MRRELLSLPLGQAYELFSFGTSLPQPDTPKAMMAASRHHPPLLGSVEVDSGVRITFSKPLRI